MDSRKILLGKSSKSLDIAIDTSMLTRHGLIAGATGTGKTITLQRLIDEISTNGIPVFTADIKGDLAGLCLPGGGNLKIEARVSELGLTPFHYTANPTVFWDLNGRVGVPLRTTISEVGPILLSQMLSLNDTQAGAMQVLFRAADAEGLTLLDSKDLEALVSWAGENLSRLSNSFGQIGKQTLGVIQRELMNLAELGGENFFGEPALSIDHLMQRDYSGRGVVNVLDATTVISEPRIYCAFLMWLLSELFESLPEQGDTPLPKLVFFFDEAHLLFRDASRNLIEKVERLVKLIRSKGVGVFFVTQNPADIPPSISAQLGHRIQHALRIYSEQERKALKGIAQSLRPNEDFDTIEAIEKLAIGEAVVSILDTSGVPAPVQITRIAPPASRLGPITKLEREQVLSTNPMSGIYTNGIDRESAFELLQKRTATLTQNAAPVLARGRERQGIFEAFFKSTARTIGSHVGRQIARGILGSIFRQR